MRKFYNRLKKDETCTGITGIILPLGKGDTIFIK